MYTIKVLGCGKYREATIVATLECGKYFCLAYEGKKSFWWNPCKEDMEIINKLRNKYGYSKMFFKRVAKLMENWGYIEDCEIWRI